MAPSIASKRNVSPEKYPPMTDDYWERYSGRIMGDRRHGQEGALAPLWKCCKLFLCH